MQSRFLAVAAIAGFLAVALGAFGAHGLKNVLNEYQLDIYQTAVNYQMWHALLLAVVTNLPQHRLLYWACWSLAAGIVLFSGSLYLLAVTGFSWLGMITPLGGLGFLSGWALLAVFAFKRQRSQPE
jgi:uncharacterized membrane protein YgdD (TMEM256/DUF423 family)